MAQYKVARQGDQGSHDGSYVGEIRSGDESTLVNGKALARVNDMYYCPKHGPNPITTGAQGTYDKEECIAHVGSKTQCGATITTGSPDTFVGDPPSPVTIPLKRTWIKFTLLDEQSQPVPNEKFTITFSDGSKKEEKLDKEGSVYLKDIPEGTCHITFPKLKKMGKLAKADKKIEPDTLLTRARAKSEGADGETEHEHTIMLSSAYMEILISHWQPYHRVSIEKEYNKNPFGHVALRVIVDDKDLTYDFGQYEEKGIEDDSGYLAKQLEDNKNINIEELDKKIKRYNMLADIGIWFTGRAIMYLLSRSPQGIVLMKYIFDRGYESRTSQSLLYHTPNSSIPNIFKGKGTLRVWNNFSDYAASQNNKGMKGYVYMIDKADAESINNHYSEKIKVEKVNDMKGKSMDLYILTNDYNAFNHNCTMVAMEGIKIVIPGVYFGDSSSVFPYDLEKKLQEYKKFFYIYQESFP